MKWLIYKHTNKKDGKVYIGQTRQDPKKRWDSGRGYKTNSKFTNAIQKYGWDNFEHEILESDIPTQELANEREQYYIRLYDSYYNGYNLTVGGDTNQTERMWTPEEEQIIKDTYNINCEETFRLLSSFNRTKAQVQQRASILNITSSYTVAKEWTEDELRLLEKNYSQLAKADLCRLFPGRKPSAVKAKAKKLHLKSNYKLNAEHNRDECIQLARQGKTVTQIAEKLSLSTGTVSVILKNNNITAVSGNPEPWTEEELHILEKYYPTEGKDITTRLPGRAYNSILQKANELHIKRIRGIKVLCIETGTVYATISDATKATHTDKKGVANCCKGKTGYKTAGGYHWKYVEE